MAVCNEPWRGVIAEIGKGTSGCGRVRSRNYARSQSFGEVGISRPISRASRRGSPGHASNKTRGEIRRATNRRTSATMITSSSGPMTGRNSGIKSIGEMTQINARMVSQRAWRGTAGWRRSRRIVVAQAGRNAASSCAKPGGSRLARTINIVHKTPITPPPMTTHRTHSIALVMRSADGLGAVRPVVVFEHGLESCNLCVLKIDLFLRISRIGSA